MMQLLRSLVFTLLLIASALIWGIVVTLTAPFSYPTRFRVVQAWVRFVLGALKVLCRLDYVVEGTENLPDRASVVYVKHSSTWETIAQAIVFPTSTWVLKRELMWLPSVGWGLAALRPIAINRKAHATAVTQVIEKGGVRLAEGTWIVIWPEGTRMAPGQTRRYGLSGALLATRTGAPLVPVAHNAGDYWPRRSVLKRPGTIRIVIGPPIATEGRDAQDVNAEAKAWIDAKMVELSPAHRDVPAEAAAGT